MFQFLLPFLEALGIGTGATGAAGAGLAGGAGTAIGSAGLTGAEMAALPASLTAPEAATLFGSVAEAPMATGGLGTLANRLAPNLMGMGKNLMGGNFQGAGGNLANMFKAPNLANMISNPSWANLGKIGEGMGDKMVAAGVTKGLLGSPQQQQAMTMSPGSVEKKVQIAPPEQITQDPVLQRMYNNLNPQFQAQPMKPWPPSPYPRRMSPV